MADYIDSDLMAAFGHEAESLGSQAAMDLLITAASRFFDNACDVADDFFQVAGTSYASRDFYGDGTAYLKLDPFTALNTVNPVVIDADADVNYDLPAYSTRGNVLVVDAKTKQQGDIVASYWNRYEGWRNGVKVTVSAKWGFTAVPADVQMAVIAIAWQMRRTSDPAFERISGGDGKPAAIVLPATAQETVDKYREMYSQNALFG